MPSLPKLCVMYEVQPIYKVFVSSLIPLVLNPHSHADFNNNTIIDPTGDIGLPSAPISSFASSSPHLHSLFASHSQGKWKMTTVCLIVCASEVEVALYRMSSTKNYVHT